MVNEAGGGDDLTVANERGMFLRAGVGAKNVAGVDREIDQKARDLLTLKPERSQDRRRSRQRRHGMSRRAASRTSLKPGSDISGVPASETSATATPSPGRGEDLGRAPRCARARAGVAPYAVTFDEAPRAGCPRKRRGRRRPRLERADRNVPEIADRGGDEMEARPWALGTGNHVSTHRIGCVVLRFPSAFGLSC